ncbi:MAG: septum formation initiator family protein [Spirochaetales bacterium]|nr:septum formation initiator family protein [Spirochaetales bacterium]
MYILLILVLGDYGIAEKRRLQDYRGVLTENLNELEILNESLNEKAASLRTEAETLQIYARNLDYYRQNEGVILVEDRQREQSTYSMGKMLAWNRKIVTKTPLFRVLSLSFGIIIYLLMSLFFPGERNDNFVRR